MTASVVNAIGRLALGVLVAVGVATVYATAIGYLVGQQTFFIAAGALFIGAVAGIVAARESPLFEQNYRPRWNFWKILVVTVFVLFMLRSFLWLVFYKGEEIQIGSEYNTGDLCIHWTFIEHVASGAAFWPDNPIYAQARLSYPLGMDLFNALLRLVGVDLFQGLIWVGLLLSGVSLVALVYFGRGFAVAGFLFAGGLIGFKFFTTGDFEDYQNAVEWKSLPLALLVTQRGLLFGLPAGLLLLGSWITRSESVAGRRPLKTWVEVVLYANLPLFHFHTFLFLSLVLLGLFLVNAGSLRRHGLLVVGCAVVPASLLVFLALNPLHSASSLGWHPGWMLGENNPWTFWIVNFGLLLPLGLWTLVAVLLSRRQSTKVDRVLVVTAVSIFILCCFVRFAPWAWDNTKLMLWSYLAIFPAMWKLVISKQILVVRWLLCFGFFFSGFVSLVGGLDPAKKFVIAQRSEIAATKVLVRDIPRDAVFAGLPDFNHPLLLNGRKMVMGYPGHLWSHGYEYLPTEKELFDLMAGNQGWELAAENLGVTHIYWSGKEQRHYGLDLKQWQLRGDRIGTRNDITIYELPNSKPK